MTLARKLAGIGAVFLGVALLSVGLSIWVTWQIAGAGAAINEVGRVRMLSYKMALHLRDHQERSRPDASADVRQRLTAIQARLSLLNRSSTERPLAVPRCEVVRLQVLAVETRSEALGRIGMTAQVRMVWAPGERLFPFAGDVAADAEAALEGLRAGLVAHIEGLQHPHGPTGPVTRALV